MRRRPFVAIAIAALLGGGIAFGISRIDVGERLKDLTLPLQHEDIIRQQAADKDVDAALIAAVIDVESGFAPRESSAGALGLMQITPDTADLIERLSGGTTFQTSDLANPDINIRYGTFLLHYLLDRYGGNQVAALAAYNAGITNVDAWGGSDLTPGDIQFPETRAYVENVLRERNDYARKRAAELGLG
jgi:soluble lytic murein transglycosylase